MYRHFADLDAVFAACTAHWDALNPRPDADAWSAIPDLETRARQAFESVYGWHRDHAAELSPIYRDLAALPETARLWLAAEDGVVADSIVAGYGDGTVQDRRLERALASHLVRFSTWRSLTMEQGLDQNEAIDLAVRSLSSVAAGGRVERTDAD